MATVKAIKVKRSQEESARSGVFWDIDFVHRQADPVNCPEGTVFIADDDVHLVAHTHSVQQAIGHGRLVAVEDGGEFVIGEEDVMATDAARELAAEAGVDLAEVPPSGANGQVVKSDVQKYIQRAKEGR